MANDLAVVTGQLVLANERLSDVYEQQQSERSPADVLMGFFAEQLRVLETIRDTLAVSLSIQMQQYDAQRLEALRNLERHRESMNARVTPPPTDGPDNVPSADDAEKELSAGWTMWLSGFVASLTASNFGFTGILEKKLVKQFRLYGTRIREAFRFPKLERELSNLRNAFEAGVKNLRGRARDLRTGAFRALNSFERLVRGMGSVFTALKLDKVIEFVRDMASRVKSAFTRTFITPFQSFFKAIGTVAKTFGGVFMKLLRPIAVIMSLFDGLRVAGDEAEKAESSFGAVLRGAVGFVSGFIGSFIGEFVNLIKDSILWVVKKIFPGIVDDEGNFDTSTLMGSILQGFQEFDFNKKIVEGFSMLMDAITTFPEDIMAILNYWGMGIGEWFTEKKEAISQSINETIESIQEIWETITGFVTEAWEGLKNKVKDAGKSIAGFFGFGDDELEEADKSDPKTVKDVLNDEAEKREVERKVKEGESGQDLGTTKKKDLAATIVYGKTQEQLDRPEMPASEVTAQQLAVETEQRNENMAVAGGNTTAISDNSSKSTTNVSNTMALVQEAPDPFDRAYGVS